MLRRVRLRLLLTRPQHGCLCGRLDHGERGSQQRLRHHFERGERDDVGAGPSGNRLIDTFA
jgi:hypothetical protein